MNTQSTSLPTDAEAIARIEREPLPERLVGDINRVEFDAAYWEKQANILRQQRDMLWRAADLCADALETHGVAPMIIAMTRDALALGTGSPHANP